LPTRGPNLAYDVGRNDPLDRRKLCQFRLELLPGGREFLDIAIEPDEIEFARQAANQAMFLLDHHKHFGQFISGRIRVVEISFGPADIRHQRHAKDSGDRQRRERGRGQRNQHLEAQAPRRLAELSADACHGLPTDSTASTTRLTCSGASLRNAR
jgi:hypothetical protein